MINKQNITTAGLCFTYAGCFFGAGYVSGQELWQFFGSYGAKGYIGITISAVLFLIFGVLLLRTVKLSGKSTIDEVIIPGNHKIIGKIFSLLVIFFMFGIFVIMSAGAGALVNQVFDLPSFIGCALFCLLIFYFSLYGISGTVKIFTVLTPVLVVSTLVICFFTLKKYGITTPGEPEQNNFLLGPYWFSALTYVSFNMIASIGTIIPLGKFIKRKRTVYSGILLACILMLLVALGIVLAITTMSASVTKELPMLDVAFRLGDVFGYIYSALLLIGMFGTSLASMVAITEYFSEKSVFFVNNKRFLIFIIGILAFVCSLSGFGNLVGTVYPIFGYAGFGVLLLIVINYIISKSKAKK